MTQHGQLSSARARKSARVHSDTALISQSLPPSDESVNRTHSPLSSQPTTRRCGRIHKRERRITKWSRREIRTATDGTRQLAQRGANGTGANKTRSAIHSDAERTRLGSKQRAWSEHRGTGLLLLRLQRLAASLRAQMERKGVHCMRSRASFSVFAYCSAALHVVMPQWSPPGKGCL